MTGSEMGGLVIGFVKYIAGFFAVVFAVGGAFAGGWFQVALLVVAAILAVVTLLTHRAIKRYEERYYAQQAEWKVQQRARNPQLYAAVDKLQALPLPGKSGVGYGLTSMSPDTYGLFVYVRPEEWDGPNPVSVGGVAYSEWLKQVPESIDGFKVAVRPEKLRSKVVS